MFSERYRYAAGLVSLLLLLSFSSLHKAWAQNAIIKGRVTDAATHKPLSYANIYVAATGGGTSTDDNGYYSLRIDSGETVELQYSLLGYKTVVKKVTAIAQQVIDIRLDYDAKQLNDVVIRSGKKKKYRNKDNPAVELIRQVIANKSQNRIEYYDYFEYEQYEKIQMSLSNAPEKLKKNLLFKKYTMLTGNLDTTTLEGKALMPLYLKETISTVYYRKHPEKKKTIITGEKQITFDDFIDNQGMNSYFKHLYQDIDLYKENITVFTNQFLSPIADAAPTFYKYYISDTVIDNGQKLVKLFFAPRNKADFLFQGSMFITLDDRYALQKLDMQVNKYINLNWVRELHILQDYYRQTDGHLQLSKSVLSAEFGITKNGKGGIFGQRTVSFRNYAINTVRADSLYKGADVTSVSNAAKRSDSFWVASRHDSLTRSEANVYANLDSVQHTKSFKRTMDIITALVAGYKKGGPYVEVGPLNTFYSFNPVEGFRLRVGGRTTTKLSKTVYLETYAAYGFKDKKWKYFLGTTFSLTGRSIYEFPVKAIRASYQKDTKIPGQELQFVQEDNFLLSFKRGVNDKWLYNDIYNIDLINEFPSHFSYKINFKNWIQTAAGGLHYQEVTAGHVTEISNITTSEVGLELRWAPKEEFYQGKAYRIPIFNRYPVFTLRSTFGIKGIFNSQYNYQHVSLNIYKHVYLSLLGYSDVILEGGYIFNQLPYPLLDIHRANQTYSYQISSYNMMNFLEFVSDHYVSLNIDHCFNGFLFNKIPLIRKLKLREYINVKVLYGGLRNENSPASHNELLKLPTDENGNPLTFALNSQPYVEGSIGIGNILKFFRIDLVKRFAYLDLPNVTELGIRGRFKFDF